MTSSLSVAARHSWFWKLEEHPHSTTVEPLAARQWPSTRIVPSWTVVHDWFDLPVQLDRSTFVPFAVFEPGSSRHFPVPPTCLICPAKPLLAAGIAQVNVVEPDAYRPSDAETCTV